VIQGIYSWFANGLLLLMEWVWNVLDTATTPRLTEAWFTNGLIRPLAGVAVGITVAMMLASAIQAGLGGRPELIIDALKEGPKSLVATALTVAVVDVMMMKKYIGKGPDGLGMWKERPAGAASTAAAD
jgi:hypothetical protein